MSQLVEIAKTLKAKARKHPDHDAVFNRRNGLNLTMSRRGIYWKLCLARHSVPPSELEVEIIRRDFDVPDHAYRVDAIPVNTITIRMYTVTLSWPESTVTP